jgi:hypothetical protein
LHLYAQRDFCFIPLLGQFASIASLGANIGGEAVRATVAFGLGQVRDEQLTRGQARVLTGGAVAAVGDIGEP